MFESSASEDDTSCSLHDNLNAQSIFMRTRTYFSLLFFLIGRASSDNSFYVIM